MLDLQTFIHVWKRPHSDVHFLKVFLLSSNPPQPSRDRSSIMHMLGSEVSAQLRNSFVVDCSSGSWSDSAWAENFSPWYRHHSFKAFSSSSAVGLLSLSIVNICERYLLSTFGVLSFPKFPRFFSFGLFSKAGPSIKQVRIEYIHTFIYISKFIGVARLICVLPPSRSVKKNES